MNLSENILRNPVRLLKDFGFCWLRINIYENSEKLENTFLKFRLKKPKFIVRSEFTVHVIVIDLSFFWFSWFEWFVTIVIRMWDTFLYNAFGFRYLKENIRYHIQVIKYLLFIFMKRQLGQHLQWQQTRENSTMNKSTTVSKWIGHKIFPFLPKWSCLVCNTYYINFGNKFIYLTSSQTNQSPKN